MATAPSEEELLQAVERYASRRGAVMGTASLTWQSVFECRIVRSIERREERQVRAKGRKRPGAPTYTDLAAHPVTPPLDPGTRQEVVLVREGSPAEVECGDCVRGKRDCAACEGSGRRSCPRHVECAVCRGGPDACWECEGTGRPTTHRARRTAPRPEGAPERSACRRCERPEVACPGCLGERRVPCPACRGTGAVTCGTCRGARRLRHQECGGTGVFTEWTQGVVTHTPDTDQVKAARYPFLSRLRKGRWHAAELTRATDKLPDFLEDVHREQVEPLLARREGEVRRRVTLRHLPLVRVVFAAAPDSIYYAFPGRTGVVVVHRPSRESVTGLAWSLGVLLVLIVVLLLTVWR
ncbi:hypothetical protein JCM4814A_69330 [Streptomyces phaeofaciens JCM 4814]|uniref:Uncharacterized protein n=1 Tax=Streptomyces phaeofaciens TaxID=68254 RepID=A0A918H7D2_9ACTN|nr:hypothetical protein [Streptomyces phaeofaciens]GGT41887.1 hypothetical protein GCM10010226_17980 [Streptomyces phaeofaciens]